MTRTLDRDNGIGIGVDQANADERQAASSMSSCDEPIRRARRPASPTRLAATGRMVSKRSTARRVTTSNVVVSEVGLSSVVREADSMRVFCILTSVNVRARVISRRKVAFLWLDSMRVREMCGAQSLKGMPGNPAPEPRSATRAGVVGREEPSGAKAPVFCRQVTRP